VRRKRSGRGSCPDRDDTASFCPSGEGDHALVKQGDEYLLPVPDDLSAQLGLRVDDDVDLIALGDGTFGIALLRRSDQDAGTGK
jgi:hypothetical protein